MYITSQAYKEEQKQELREKSYVYVYMGLINQYARDAATVLNGLTAYSNIDSAFRNNSEKVGLYATLEDNFTRVNNTNAFLPRRTALYNNNQGIATESPSGSIRITFGSLVDVDIKGLTINFGYAYPTEFTVSNGTDTFTYTKDNADLFTCEDQFDNCEYLEITPVTMVGGQQRLRILSMEFGIGLSFDNSSLISTQRRNTVSHVSESLPLKAFDFTVDNLSRRFSQDNPRSYANYIQEGQKVEFRYGRDLGDGNIEYIPGGKTYIKTWSSNDLNAKFSTVGRLEMMDNEYYKGYYSNTPGNQRSAYDCAVEVFTDAGLTSSEYSIASYLKTIPIINPLPVATHKACLQMIANMSKSILMEDREGKISIKSSFVPKITQNDIHIVHADVVSPEAFDMSQKTYDWATLEEGFTRVDNTMYFRARNNPLTPGIISDLGVLEFSLTFDYQWSFTAITMYLSGNILPETLEVKLYRNSVELHDLIITKPESKVVNFEGYFEEIDEIRVLGTILGEESLLVNEFDDYLETENMDELLYAYAGDTSRIHISHMIITNNTGHTITNTDLAQKPTATSIDRIKAINVNYYSYVPTTAYKQITTAEVVAGQNIIKFPNPSTSYRVLWEDQNLQEWSDTKEYATGDLVKYDGIKYRCLVSGSKGKRPDTNPSNWQAVNDVYNDVSIVDYGAYYIKLNVSTVRGKLVIYGTVMDVNYTTYSRPLHDIGNAKNLNNVLIRNASMAQDITDWLEEHYANDTEYTIQYRGEPSLDCDDLVYLENQFVTDNLCRIEEEEISTAIGMSLTNNMKLRRLSYTMD